MPELNLYFLNDTAYPDPTYEPPFTFVGDVNALKYTIFSSVDCEFGFRWSVDNQLQVISTDTYQLIGGNEESVLVPITARYVQIFVNNIASNPCDLKTQVFFLTNFSGLEGPIESVGDGVSLVDDDGNIKSLTSNDGSVIITDNGDEVNLGVYSFNFFLLIVVLIL